MLFELHKFFGETLIVLTLVMTVYAAIRAGSNRVVPMGMLTGLSGLLDLQVLLGIVLALTITLPWSRIFIHPLLMATAAVLVHAAARKPGASATLLWAAMTALVLGYMGIAWTLR